MHMNRDTTISGVRVRLRATSVGTKHWTWQYHCENGLTGSNSEELAPTHVIALGEAEDAARSALRAHGVQGE